MEGAEAMEQEKKEQERKEQERFSYRYSGKEQEEIRSIEKKYSETFGESEGSGERGKTAIPRHGSIEELRRLDSSVTRKGICVAVLVGLAGTLVFGLGLACCLVFTKWLALGILLAILGLVMMAAAVPVFGYITLKEKERLSGSILSMAEELKKS